MVQEQIYKEFECFNGVTVRLIQVWEYGDVKKIIVQQEYADGSEKECVGYGEEFLDAAKYYNYLVTKNNN